MYLDVNLFLSSVDVWGLFLELGREGGNYELFFIRELQKSNGVFAYFFFSEISSLSLAIKLYICSQLEEK